MGRKRETSWPGGRIRYAADGTPTYEVRKVVQTQLGPQRHEFSTRCHTYEGATKVLERWEADHTYRPVDTIAQVHAVERVPLTETLIAEFRQWSGKPKDEGGRANSPTWVSNQCQHLRWWQSKLGDRDLRKLTIDTIEEVIVGAKSLNQRKAVLKTFYSWMRTARVPRLVTTAQDPTYGQLRVEQSSPEQWKVVKAWTKEETTKTREHLEGEMRDAFDIQVGTGWHVSELQRFIRTGVIEEYRGEDPDVAGVLFCEYGKNKEPLRTAVSSEVLEAAKRLIDLERPSDEYRKSLFERVWGAPVSKVAEELGVSDVGLAKHCRALSIPLPPRGYWMRKQFGVPVEVPELPPRDLLSWTSRRSRWGYRRYLKSVKEASSKAGLSVTLFPGEARHTVATWAVNAGADLKTVSTFLRHKSERTTRRFYATHAVAAKVPTLL